MKTRTVSCVQQDTIQTDSLQQNALCVRQATYAQEELQEKTQEQKMTEATRVLEATTVLLEK